MTRASDEWTGVTERGRRGAMNGRVGIREEFVGGRGWETGSREKGIKNKRQSRRYNRHGDEGRGKCEERKKEGNKKMDWLGL